jgi:hypothetical protein
MLGTFYILERERLRPNLSLVQQCLQYQSRLLKHPASKALVKMSLDWQQQKEFQGSHLLFALRVSMHLHHLALESP